ncbi:MAG: lysoplasmalogenase [Xanthobacteraceae bacterium]
MMPFPGSVGNVDNIALLISAVAAVLYLLMLGRGTSWWLSLAKTLSTSLLALIAWRMGGPVLLVAGLALSALGDLFLSRDGEKAFISGLVSFLVAHVAYIVLFASIGQSPAVLLSMPLVLPAVGLIAISLALLRIILRHVSDELRLPVMVYCTALVLMGLTALATERSLLIAGAMMFVASDAILAWEKFVEPATSPRKPPMRFAVWVLYYAAQVTFLLAFAMR